ncbi:unnamed protein product [Rodentolepis nana]|uniref:Integrase n=1 Tax=Rodentolepis nana TaxID=102285 RepID=A0A0R3TZL8_RODNA|nr:unnamed protein product [Rodentolepis nana]
MIRCAKKTIPRGKITHYRVFWSKHLEVINTIECFGPNTLRKLKESGTPFATLLIRDALRKTADQTGRTKPGDDNQQS